MGESLASILKTIGLYRQLSIETIIDKQPCVVMPKQDQVTGVGGQQAPNITATNQHNNCREIHTSSPRPGLPPESEQQQQPILSREQQQEQAPEPTYHQWNQQQQQAAGVNLTTPCNQARQQPTQQRIPHAAWPEIFALRAQLQDQRRSRGVNITTSERHRIEVEQHRIESVRRFRYDDY